MKSLFLPILIIFLAGCEFSKSVSKDLVTGITTSSNGLSADEVYLTSGDDRLSRTSFTYGERIFFHFDNLQGFQKKDGKSFAGMAMTVTGVAGDTLLHYDDLLAENSDGLDEDPLTLTANLVMAQPLKSGEKYHWNINITDKNGTGQLEARMDIELISNSAIRIENKGIGYREIYLYSSVQSQIITGNTITADEDVYLVFEGLRGITPTGDVVPAGLSMHATDASGRELLHEADLIGDGGMEPDQFAKQVAPSLNLSGTDIKNPVLCEVKIWNKNNDNFLTARFDLNIKQ